VTVTGRTERQLTVSLILSITSATQCASENHPDPRAGSRECRAKREVTSGEGGKCGEDWGERSDGNGNQGASDNYRRGSGGGHFPRMPWRGNVAISGKEAA
jgi:hypothetical protein